MRFDRIVHTQKLPIDSTFNLTFEHELHLFIVFAWICVDGLIDSILNSNSLNSILCLMQ